MTGKPSRGKAPDAKALGPGGGRQPIGGAQIGDGGWVDLRPLKASIQRLRADHPLRELILAEEDRMRKTEYGAKAEVWYRLLRSSQQK